MSAVAARLGPFGMRIRPLLGLSERTRRFCGVLGIAGLIGTGLVIAVGVIVLRRPSRRNAGTWLPAAHRRLPCALEVCLGRAARASCAAR